MNNISMSKPPLSADVTLFSYWSGIHCFLFAEVANTKMLSKGFKRPINDLFLADQDKLLAPFWMKWKGLLTHGIELYPLRGLRICVERNDDPSDNENVDIDLLPIILLTRYKSTNYIFMLCMCLKELLLLGWSAPILPNLKEFSIPKISISYKI